jgi:hypothetical protein
MRLFVLLCALAVAFALETGMPEPGATGMAPTGGAEPFKCTPVTSSPLSSFDVSYLTGKWYEVARTKLPDDLKPPVDCICKRSNFVILTDKLETTTKCTLVNSTGPVVTVKSDSTQEDGSGLFLTNVTNIDVADHMTEEQEHILEQRIGEFSREFVERMEESSNTNLRQRHRPQAVRRPGARSRAAPEAPLEPGMEKIAVIYKSDNWFAVSFVCQELVSVMHKTAIISVRDWTDIESSLRTNNVILPTVVFEPSWQSESCEARLTFES